VQLPQILRSVIVLITGWEWIVILLIIAALILWGPKKLPELARSIGEARREFERASKEVTSLPPTTETKPSGDDLLVETAKKLGISTEGKTKEQISQEIVEKVKAESP